MKPPLVLIHTKKGGEGEEGVIRQTDIQQHPE
jgi:hypothetical protein